MKTDVYKDIAEDVEASFDTSLPKRKNKKSKWINERWIRWKNHEKRFVGLRTKNYIYWCWSNEDAGIDAGIEDKKAKCTKNVP